MSRLRKLKPGYRKQETCINGEHMMRSSMGLFLGTRIWSVSSVFSPTSSSSLSVSSSPPVSPSANELSSRISKNCAKRFSCVILFLFQTN